ncbi:hypothetical protein U1Q18_012911 [Sarracenia purpurea var. burkii]
MKRFEEEISTLPPPTMTVVDLISDSGESHPELGYLLEAFDDELGIPPSTSPIRLLQIRCLVLFYFVQFQVN